MKKILCLFSHRPMVQIITIALVGGVIFSPGSVQAVSPISHDKYTAGDIQFCPEGLAYEDVSCSLKRTKMNDAIGDALTAAGSGQSGTIYIEGGSYSGTTNDSTGAEIDISAFNYGTSLVIQGGVNSGTTTFVRALYINSNTGLDLTVSDVNVSVSSSATDLGILATDHTGDLFFERIYIHDGNKEGIKVHSITGNVKMTGLESWLNQNTNILIDAISGDVQLSNINSNDSVNGQGIEINNVQGKNGVTLTEVTALRNHENNINIWGITNNVTMTIIQADSSDSEAGIRLYDIQGKKGAILTEITANENSGANMDINNLNGDLNITDSTTNHSINNIGILIEDVRGKKGVTISQADTIENYGDNLRISNIVSTVSLDVVDASNSVGGYGVRAYALAGKKGTTLTNIISFSNYGSNISIFDTEGDVTLTNIEAFYSDSVGIEIKNIRGKKGVSINNATASYNTSVNYIVQTISGGVTFNGVSANNGGDGGILIDSITGNKGVSLTDITANSNNNINLIISNISGDANLNAVTCDGSVNNHGIYMYDIFGKKGVTLTGVIASNNKTANIQIGSINGNISLSTVTTNNSQSSRGIEISSILGSKGVTLKDVIANGNNMENILIGSISGNVSLTNTQTHNSVTRSGLRMYTITGSKGITFTNVASNGNTETGLEITDISGSAKFTGVETNNSVTNYGIYLDHIHGKAGVILTDITSIDNYYTNIDVNDVDGSLNLTGVTANGSKSNYGIHVTNILGSKGVDFRNVDANNNDSYNIFLGTISGNATLKNITADGSAKSFGVYILNVTGSKGITISNLDASNNNTTNVKVVSISGDIKISDLTAYGSVTDEGLYISTVQGKKGIALSSSTISGNYNNNIKIQNVTPGNVSLNKVIADNSIAQNGAYASGLDGTLMIISSTFTGNQLLGISTSNINGLVALNNVVAKNNIGSDGANLSSSNYQLVCGGEFSNNGGHGIFASADGYSITLSDVTFSGNGSGDYTSSGTIVKNESTKCKVIPVP